MERHGGGFGGGDAQVVGGVGGGEGVGMMTSAGPPGGAGPAGPGQAGAGGAGAGVAGAAGVGVGAGGAPAVGAGAVAALAAAHQLHRFYILNRRSECVFRWDLLRDRVPPPAPPGPGAVPAPTGIRTLEELHAAPAPVERAAAHGPGGAHAEGDRRALEEETKLMAGMLYSLKRWVFNSSPYPHRESSGLHFFRTTAYCLHFYETASGWKFVLLTDPGAPDMRELLEAVHRTCFVECVVKNPLHDLNQPGLSLHSCELFVKALRRLLVPSARA